MFASNELLVFEYSSAGDNRFVYPATLNLALCNFDKSTISQVIDDVFNIALKVAYRLTRNRVLVDKRRLFLLDHFVKLSDLNCVMRQPWNTQSLGFWNDGISSASRSYFSAKSSQPFWLIEWITVQ